MTLNDTDCDLCKAVRCINSLWNLSLHICVYPVYAANRDVSPPSDKDCHHSAVLPGREQLRPASEVHGGESAS